jgi:putative spermidine/putrescine transport system ATP-binding protein
MAGVKLQNIEKRYGDFTAVRDVSLQIAAGEFVTFLGASGSGKTTCLRMIAGFIKPDQGKVLIDEEDVTHVPPHKRNTGMVFQQYALFPHMTVAQNVSFGLRVRRLPKAEVTKRTMDALQLVRLERFADRYPTQLSGGQKQRVALARAVVIGPRVLLLDEPLAALDLKLREELQGEIKRVQQTLGITTVFVTHDQGEALSMSDRVVVMRDGSILQVDTPARLYRHPNCRYVANFVGRTNLLDGVVQEAGAGHYVISLTDHPGRLVDVRGTQATSFKRGDKCLVAFRPEDGRLQGSERNCIVARLDKATYMGSEWMLNLTGADQRLISITLPRSATVPDVNAEVAISWLPEQAILLPYEDA